MTKTLAFTPNPDAIDVEEAAPIVGLTPAHLYSALANGHIPRGIFWRVGRRIRLSRSRLTEWVAGGGSAADSAQRTA